MIQLDILFLDDDLGGMLDLFETDIEAWNKINLADDRKFNVVSVTNIIDARQTRFDGAIVDLRLPDENGKGDDAENGSSFAASVVNARGVPVAVVSGHVVELSQELKDLDHFRSFSKNDGYSPVVSWLSDQWEMMTTLRIARENIEVASAEVFSKRLWPQWQNTPALSQGSRDQRAKIVTRQFASHISDLLGLDNEQNPDWHPFENYVVPALTVDRTHTGDLFNVDDEIWIVLSPQCDMANANISNVLLAKCTLGHNDWAPNIAKLKGDPTQKKPLRKIRDFVNQNIERSKHFLPPLPGEDKPILVDFSDVFTRPLEDLNKQLDVRLASVSAPFLSNLVQRFGAYISRTGQPNIDITHFFEN